MIVVVGTISQYMDGDHYYASLRFPGEPREDVGRCGTWSQAKCAVETAFRSRVDNRNGLREYQGLAPLVYELRIKSY